MDFPLRQLVPLFSFSSSHSYRQAHPPCSSAIPANLTASTGTIPSSHSPLPSSLLIPDPLSSAYRDAPCRYGEHGYLSNTPLNFWRNAAVCPDATSLGTPEIRTPQAGSGSDPSRWHALLAGKQQQALHELRPCKYIHQNQTNNSKTKSKTRQTQKHKKIQQTAKINVSRLLSVSEQITALPRVCSAPSPTPGSVACCPCHPPLLSDTCDGESPWVLQRWMGASQAASTSV